MRVGLQWLIIATGLCTATSVVLGHSPQSNQEAGTVTIPFFVTDRQGVAVHGIIASDLVIREDKEPPESIVGLRGPTELPLRLAVVIQDSGSMKGNSLFQRTLASLPAFLRSVMVGNMDRVFFESFSNHVYASNWVDVAASARLSFEIHSWGGSALYDALESACTKMGADSNWPARRIILLVTDGHDNRSGASDSAAKAALLRSHSALFILQIPQVAAGPVPDLSTSDLLKDAVDLGGGAFVASPQGWAPSLSSTEPETNDTNPQAALARTEQWVNGMYAVVFVPNPSRRTKQHHNLKIELAPNHRGWHMHAPKRYDDN